jgi:hypothetical protein
VPRILTVALLSLLAGCSTSSTLFGRASTPEGTSVTGDSGIDTQGLALYLQMMADLVDGDSVTQAEVFERINRDAEVAPTTTNLLKLALALAVPGHPGSHAENAAIELRALLAEEAVLLPEERVLAEIHLADVEQRLVLEGQTTQLEASMSEEMNRQLSAADERIGALEAENLRLRRELESTREILEEIANIERDIRERDNGSDQ